MTSNWIKFVKDFSKMNSIPYNEALKIAKPYYYKSGYSQGSGSKRKIKKKTRAKKMNNNKLASTLLGAYGGAAQKGALAALLSGLNATIKVD